MVKPKNPLPHVPIPQSSNKRSLSDENHHDPLLFLHHFFIPFFPSSLYPLLICPKKIFPQETCQKNFLFSNRFNSLSCSISRKYFSAHEAKPRFPGYKISSQLSSKAYHLYHLGYAGINRCGHYSANYPQNYPANTGHPE